MVPLAPQGAEPEAEAETIAEPVVQQLDERQVPVDEPQLEAAVEELAEPSTVSVSEPERVEPTRQTRYGRQVKRPNKYKDFVSDY
jgi:hypothetical protein